jgi:hypothetical protein
MDFRRTQGSPRCRGARAADIARDLYQRNIEVRFKEDKSPVTEADVRCETAIREILEARFPSYGFYGEETGSRDVDAESLWLVDPIDGTKAFVREYPMFSTQIALMRGGELVLGVSSAPVYGELACRARPRRLPQRQAHHVSSVSTWRRGAVLGQLEIACRRRAMGALRQAGHAGESHPRLWRFPALPSARRRQDRRGDRIRRQHPGHRRLRRDRDGGGRTVHSTLAAAPITLSSTTVLASNGPALHAAVL